MRDIIVTTIVLVALPFILKNPFNGVLMWAWLSYMNPHRLTYGFAYSLPFAQIVAVTLLISFAISRQKKFFVFDSLTAVWLAYVLWMVLTSFMAIYPDSAQYYLTDRLLKVQIMTLVTIMCLSSLDRVNRLLWVIVLSVGYFSVKGGIFTVLTGGAYRVWGPPLTLLEENNGLAVATLMIIPLMLYLRTTVTHVWLKHGLLFAAIISFVSVLGSQSRGAFLATAVLGGFFWLKSSRKLVTAVACIVLAIAGLSFMPQEYWERIETIRSYQEDNSAMGRINAWAMAVEIANDRLTGGGFNPYTSETYEIYSPTYDGGHVPVAHSIYFQVIASQGWPGLLMWLAILYLTWRGLAQVIRLSRGRPELASHGQLAKMLQVSVIAFASGGAFLDLAYFDLAWTLIGIAYVLRHHTLALGQEQPIDRPEKRARRKESRGGAPGSREGAPLSARERSRVSEPVNASGRVATGPPSDA